MQINHKNFFTGGQTIFGLIALTTVAAVAYWFSIYSAASLNFNVIWLAECGQRILTGARMADICFETNPPLSIILYMPLVWLDMWLPQVSLAVLFPLYTLAFVLLASGAVYYLLRKIPPFTPRDALILSLLFLMANTALTGRFFGERDHFVLLGVFVFFLAQYTITLKSSGNKLTLCLILIISGIGILIKPHYGLIPFLMMLDRLRKWQSLRGIFQADILILGGLCALYLSIILAYFSDYALHILPESAALYASAQFHEAFFMPFLKGAALLVLCWFAVDRNADEGIRPFLNRLFGLAAIALFVFLIQKKGWGYHLVPFYGVFFCALFFSLYLIVPTVQNSQSRARSMTGGILAMALAAAYLVNPIPREAPGHHDFRQYNLAEEIRDAPQGEPCTFMMFAGMREVQSLAYYNDCKLASRFAVIWFFSPVADYLNAKDEAATTKAAAKIKYYADMIAADLEHDQPHVIILRKPKEAFLNVLGETSDSFNAAWQNYTFIKTVPHETPDYFAGSPYRDMTAKQGYQIFKRKDSL